MISNFFLFLFVFCCIYFYVNKNENKKNENFTDFFDSKCHNHMYACKNYNKCCMNDNYNKLGHSKYCNDIYHVTDCNIYKKHNVNKINFNKQKRDLAYFNHSPGFAFKPSYSWGSNHRELCSPNTIDKPDNIITSKLAFNSSKFKKKKHKNTETEQFDKHKTDFFYRLKQIYLNK